MKTVYLDNNATTAVAPEVLEAMLPYFSTHYGNPSSIHKFGGMVRKKIDHAREQVAALINADPAEIVFTGCGSEGDNMAISGFKNLHGSRTRLITSKVEHPAVGNLCHYWRDKGTPLTELDVDTAGLLMPDQLNSATIDADTLVSLMWANNETGVIFPLDELAPAIKMRGGFVHTDAVQVAGKITIDVKSTPVDMLTISGHKLHAPKGIGAHYIRKGLKLPPLIIGGHQESGLRAGTENVPYIIGFGMACDLALTHMREENTRIKNLRDRLQRELLARCTGAHLNGAVEQRLPNTLNISFEFIEGEAILLLLDEHNIAASSGSACTSGSLEPSHVMRAMGVPYTLAHSSTRFSFSRYSTESDVDAVISVMPGIVDQLRKLSPYVNS